MIYAIQAWDNEKLILEREYEFDESQEPEVWGEAMIKFVDDSYDYLDELNEEKTKEVMEERMREVASEVEEEIKTKNDGE